jgi:hypothetical protein
MHEAIVRVPGLRGARVRGRTRGITGLVYGGIRGVARGVGWGLDALLPAIARSRDPRPPSARRDAALAALNGVVGDHLAATGSPLAIPMRLSHGGRPFALERGAIQADIPQAGGRLLLLVHGLCVGHRQWNRLGHDHGAALGRDLGYTVLYLDYNTGLHVSENGRALAERLEALVREWPVPVEELAVLAHSMGGLVARSACHHGAAAGHLWPRRLRALVFLGTPHHGAPLERVGNWVDAMSGASRYTAPLGRLGRIRSAGITDLRHGSVLDADWEGRDRFEWTRDRRTPVPLPGGVRCFAIAAKAASPRAPGRWLPGDGLVPVDSALGRHRRPGWTLAFPESRVWVGQGMNHFELLSRPEVSGRLRGWLRGRPGRRQAAGAREAGRGNCPGRGRARRQAGRGPASG